MSHILIISPKSYSVHFELISSVSNTLVDEFTLKHPSGKTLVTRLRSAKRANTSTSIEIENVGLRTVVTGDLNGKVIDREIFLDFENTSLQLEVDEAEALSDLLDDSSKKVGTTFRMAVDVTLS